MFRTIGNAIRNGLCARREGRRSDRGASAIEWAIIAAISVVAVTLIGGTVYNIVSSKTTNLSSCANVTAGNNC